MRGLPDDPEWCGHWHVSLRSWTCPDCGRAVTEAMRQRLESAATVAPPGSLWVLLEGEQEWDEGDGPGHHHAGSVIGLFTDRTRIGRLLVRCLIIDAESLRRRMAGIHWYQGAYNSLLFEGWEEEDNDDPYDRSPSKYTLMLEAVDRPG